jgi:hypothetical protein
MVCAIYCKTVGFDSFVVRPGADLFTAGIGQPEPEFWKDMGNEKVGDPELKLDDHEVAIRGRSSRLSEQIGCLVQACEKGTYREHNSRIS